MQGANSDFRQQWAEDYAAQSQSDFRVYVGFSTETEECHRLHYLQMSCEKIAKAYRVRDTATPIEEAARSHVAFSLFIENFLASPQIKERYSSQAAKLRIIRRRARTLAREIEKLAPAVDREQSPVNCGISVVRRANRHHTLPLSLSKSYTPQGTGRARVFAVDSSGD